MFVTQLCNKRRQKRQSQNSPTFLNYIMQSAVKHKWYWSCEQTDKEASIEWSY